MRDGGALAGGRNATRRPRLNGPAARHARAELLASFVADLRSELPGVSMFDRTGVRTWSIVNMEIGAGDDHPPARRAVRSCLDGTGGLDHGSCSWRRGRMSVEVLRRVHRDGCCEEIA